LDRNFVGVKNVVIVDVTDLAYRFADDLRNGDGTFQRLLFGQVRNGDLATDDHNVAFGECFASDAAARVMRDARVEHGV
jgi:hypothetical protein